MAAALYNRYRPRTFAEVVGQEHVTSALIAALESGRTHHAYLFSGPRGCGKTSSARILAASLNCVHGPTPTPCGECEHCVAIRSGSAIDVIEIDAASHGGVDDARDLRERALYRPASGRYRVFVIDEAHQVSRDGFNALLKVVEEPPDYLVFIFATTEPDKVLPTIRSRTFAYHFRLVPPGALRDHLARLTEAEGAHLPPEVLPLVVRAGAGSVRDAMSVLDQLLAAGVTTYEQAAALLGVTDAVLLDEATLALSARDGAALFGVVEQVIGAGHDPRSFAQDLLERLRDLVLISAVPEAAERGLVEGVPPDQLDRMRQQASVLGAAELSRAADVVANGLVEMRGTTSPRLVLELVCARLLLPAASGDAGSLAARLDAVERRLSVAQAQAPSTPVATPPPSAAPPAPPAAASAPAPSTPPPSTPAPAAPPAASASVPPAPAPGTVDATRLRESWPVVLDAVKKRQRVPYFMLHEHAQVSSVAGDRVTLAFTLAPIARQFENGTGPAVLAEALSEVVGGSWRVSVTLNEQPAAPAVEGFAPGDGPADEPSPDPVDVTDPANGAGPGPAASASASPRAEPDPVALAREAFGATVISDTDTG
ncbi:MAG TPA: DNA polymerase III subunit gamma and tau [Mycobacteriales bacterium]